MLLTTPDHLPFEPIEIVILHRYHLLCNAEAIVVAVVGEIIAET